jgi:acetoin:2,6-dichlorophenolindophenol oxidoreductase subunit alpha
MTTQDMELAKHMYRVAITIRRFEQRAIEQYRLGNIRGYFHPYLGEEAIAVGVVSTLRPDDFIVSTHRGHGHAIAKGHDLRLMFAELFGKQTGYCRGRGGSMHVANLAQGNLGANGIVGAGLPLATGAAMGIRQKGSSQVVVCFFSDGAAGNGVFHECLNLASIFRLPIVFVLENNHYAVSTPVEFSSPVPDLYVRAASYAIPGVSVDGNDAFVVHDVAAEAVSLARSNGGPSLLECKTYRHGGHHVNDPGQYMPKEKLEYWKSRDPVGMLRSKLADAGLAEADIAAIDSSVDADIEAAIQFALSSPEPSVDGFLAEVAAAE